MSYFARKTLPLLDGRCVKKCKSHDAYGKESYIPCGRVIPCPKHGRKYTKVVPMAFAKRTPKPHTETLTKLIGERIIVGMGHQSQSFQLKYTGRLERVDRTDFWTIGDGIDLVRFHTTRVLEIDTNQPVAVILKGYEDAI